MVQLHKEFTDSQVKELIERYLKREIRIHYVLEILGIKRGLSGFPNTILTNNYN